MEFCLSRCDNNEEGQQLFWEWQAARIRNYMNYLTVHHSFKPKYYNPMGDKKDEFNKFIQANHVAQIYGVMMARIWFNNNSVNAKWSVCEILDVVFCVKESIP